MQRVVFFNGNLIPESEAKLSIYDSAMMFGDVIFEMTRSFNKVQFKLREHLERLFASLKYVHLDCGMTIDEVEAACHRVITANDPIFASNDEHRLLINVTRGTLSIYTAVEGLKAGPNVIIADFPLRWTVKGMGSLYDTGVNVVVPSQRTVPADLIEPKVKNRNRLHYLMANIEVSKYKGDHNWALLLDPDGFVAEGSGSNFFVVKNGIVTTPEGRNVLRGISRAYIFDLCRELGLGCRTENFSKYDIYAADEAFMTGTPFCIIPVTSIHDSPIGTGKPGPVVSSLLAQWGSNVGVDIIEQIKGWEQEIAAGQASGVSPYQFK